MTDTEHSVPGINQPNKKHYPRMVRTNVEAFVSARNVRQEYIPDSSFEDRNLTMDGEEINYYDLFKSDFDLSPRHVMLCSSAGQGKTTLLKRFAKDVVDSTDMFPGLGNVKLVIFLEFKLMETKKESYLKDLLIGQQCPNVLPKEKDDLFSWMVQSEGSNIIFIIDGLDQFPSNFNTVSPTPAEYFKSSFAGSFIRDLFKGWIFPAAHILTSSREHAVRKLDESLIPQRIVSLHGFSSNAVDELVIEMGGEDGFNILRKLKISNIVLYTLCKTPLFLSYVVAMHKSGHIAPPKTLTEVMLNIIVNLITSTKHSRKIHLNEIRLKLMEMSYQGTKECKVLFHSSQIQDYDPYKFDDLVIVVKAPSNSLNLYNLLCGKDLLYFTHQIFQETFSALYIVSLPFFQFKHFIDTNFQDPHWSIIIRIVCGLLLDSNVSSLRDEIIEGINDLSKRRDIVLKRFKSILCEDQLTGSLLRVLYESFDGVHEILKTMVHSVNICYQSLSDYDMYCLGNILSRTSKTQELNLRSCNLTNDLIDTFIHAVTEAKLIFPVIEEIDLYNSLHISGETLADLILRFNIRRVKVEGCNLTKKDMVAFLRVMERSLKYPKIEELYASKNPGIVCSELAIIVSKCSIVRLILSQCSVSKKELKQFSETILRDPEYINIEELSIFGNPHVVSLNLAQVVTKCNIKCLNIGNCSITKAEMSEFTSAFCKGKKVSPIEVLDIKGNPRVLCRSLARLVSHCEVKRFNISCCDIFPEDIRQFVEDISAFAKFDVLHMQGNKISHDMVRDMCQLMKHVNTELKVTSGYRYCEQEVLQKLIKESKKYLKLQLEWKSR